MVPTRIRRATSDDAPGIAELHADSWRRNYRGAYSDAYLDGDLETERKVEWTTRLGAPDPDAFTVVAEQDRTVVGFVHVRLEADPACGALINNLHVLDRPRGSGIGTRLLAETGRMLVERQPAAGA
jgi:ribosomal protein S18 acetylase RimI-like enzyme